MSLVQNHIGAVFVPVRDIEAARDWYCTLLGLPPGGEILFGHLYVMPMRDGSGLVLDSKDFRAPHDGKPAFHFVSRDIAGAHRQLAAAGIEPGPITDGVWFSFRDPDGNLLMVADVPLPEKAAAPASILEQTN